MFWLAHTDGLRQIRARLHGSRYQIKSLVRSGHALFRPGSVEQTHVGNMAFCAVTAGFLAAGKSATVVGCSVHSSKPYNKRFASDENFAPAGGRETAFFCADAFLVRLN